MVEFEMMKFSSTFESLDSCIAKSRMERRRRSEVHKSLKQDSFEIPAEQTIFFLVKLLRNS